MHGQAPLQQTDAASQPVCQVTLAYSLCICHHEAHLVILHALLSSVRDARHARHAMLGMLGWACYDGHAVLGTAPEATLCPCTYKLCFYCIAVQQTQEHMVQSVDCGFCHLVQSET